MSETITTQREKINQLLKRVFTETEIKEYEEFSNLEILEEADTHIAIIYYFKEWDVAPTPALKFVKEHLGLSTKEINQLKK